MAQTIVITDTSTGVEIVEAVTTVTIESGGIPGPQGVQGIAGPANTLSIGTVSDGDTADATITGDAPNQTLSLVLPRGATGATGPQGETGATGPAGPANSLTIGTVSEGAADASITGAAPSQTLNLTLPRGATGPQGETGPQGIQGIQGPQGPQGDTGPQGIQGPTGATGPGVAAGGSAGQVLVKSSATNYDTAWQDVVGSYAPGQWYGAPIPGYADTLMVSVHEGRTQGLLIAVHRATTVDRLRAQITAGGSAGALLRLAIYRANPGAGTTTLIVDGGVIDATAASIGEVSFAPITLTPGLYVLAGRLEGGATTRPTVRMTATWNSIAQWAPLGSVVTGTGVLVHSSTFPAVGSFFSIGAITCPVVNMRIAP